ncbi:MAG: UDP-N-acetylmuramoyl-L-alanyl-D-glutamate--2,6-diaminopimelate ligase [Nitrospinae bacterium]|nr:UDP-N-acetylmuramoyl-L-alanyl-D-glutamate--2,6-diaminopimelate ligase [Nitrospinota bacterium]
MDLHELISGLEGVSLRLEGVSGPLDVTGITFDYKRLKPGNIYACLHWEEFLEPYVLSNGYAYIKEALENGASCLLTQEGVPFDEKISCPRIVAGHANKAMALIADRFHGHPMNKMKVVGVTGTNGKTTINFVLRSILSHAGRKPGIIGTMGTRSEVYNVPPGLYTTPLSTDLYHSASVMLERGVDTIVMESTSHGISLFREYGTEYDAVIFTNFSQDHLDFHKDLDDYKNVKLGLFRRLERQAVKRSPEAIINIDDPVSGEFLEAAKVRRITYGIKKPADVTARDIELSLAGSRFTIQYDQGEVLPVHFRLRGEFNVYNALACFAAARCLGLDALKIKEGLEALTEIPGRFQTIETGTDITVVVDYAHTPDSLEKILRSAKGLRPRRLIAVFGCGGDRDPKKRPVMGGLAVQISDVVIVTSDNPRTEDPSIIVDEILQGIPKEEMGKVEAIVDRREAIRRALSMAEPGDLVVIAGKGHEDYQIIGKEKVHFDDREEVSKFFMK